MDLLEYQAKELFRQIGIPVLPSQRIDRPTDLKALRIPYPIVLKSQVSVGSRGKAGGVIFVENTIDAIAAARTIFNLPILGEYPQVLLAEAKYNTSQEFYLAVGIDRLACRPVLLGSIDGGMNINAVLNQIQQVVVYEEFSSFYARRLALKMGLEGDLMLAVSDIIEKMYRLMQSHDLDLIEINPLGIDQNGRVMALDGKISVNPCAIGRHPHSIQWQVLDVVTTSPNSSRSSGESATSPPAPQVEQNSQVLSPLFSGDGNISILCSGVGLALAILDAIAQGGGQVAKCIVVDPTRIEDIKIAIATCTPPNVDILLVNFLGSDLDRCQQVLQYLPHAQNLTIVWRISAPDRDRLAGLLPLSIKFVTDFERSIAQTVAISK
jgi:succinyl-CoA synthetase beta subunit